MILLSMVSTPSSSISTAFGTRSGSAPPPWRYQDQCRVPQGLLLDFRDVITDLQVVIDDTIPFAPSSEQPLFCSSAYDGELWPSLIEKAYAKVLPPLPVATGGLSHGCTGQRACHGRIGRVDGVDPFFVDSREL